MQPEDYDRPTCTAYDLVPARRLHQNADDWRKSILAVAVEEDGYTPDDADKILLAGEILIGEWMADTAYDSGLGIAEALAPC